VVEMPVETKDIRFNNTQQDINDQSQLPIVNFPKSESTENPIIEVQTLAIEVNFLISSNSFIFLLFICTSSPHLSSLRVDQQPFSLMT
jgi:hypothetical protein